MAFRKLLKLISQPRSSGVDVSHFSGREVSNRPSASEIYDKYLGKDADPAVWAALSEEEVYELFGMKMPDPFGEDSPVSPTPDAGHDLPETVDIPGFSDIGEPEYYINDKRVPTNPLNF